MSRKMRVGEVVLAAVLMASPGWAQEAAGPPAGEVPDEIDYLMAVECSALAAALARFNPNGAREAEHAGFYLHWAEKRAAEAGRDVSLVRKDITARRKDFLAEAGDDGINSTRRDRLINRYPGQWKACLVRADIPERIFIGG